MEKQERRPESRKDTQAKEEVKPNPKVTETGKKLKEDIDKLVDELDAVLEETAAEFDKTYEQQGGEYPHQISFPLSSPSLFPLATLFVRLLTAFIPISSV